MQNKEEQVTIVSEETVSEELQTNDDGTLEEVEVYRSKAGNIVTPPKLRNQNQDNKRRDLCWEYYMKSVRDGNPNGRASALKAGFAPNTALNIGNLGWFKEKKDKLRRSKMMTNAEKNIARILNLGFTKIKKLDDGTEEEVLDLDRVKIIADMSKMIATTLGKDMGYSQKTEVKVTAMPTPIMELEAIDILPSLIEPNEVTE